jgi:hypothetical protein
MFVFPVDAAPIAANRDQSMHCLHNVNGADNGAAAAVRLDESAHALAYTRALA